MNSVWIFHGENAQFTSSVFSQKETAEKWITDNQLTGLLTNYPIDISVYDWAIENDLFKAKEARHKSSSFIQKFTSASQIHFHYENGKKLHK